MTSSFLTTNIFIINLAVMLLTTSITGGIVTLVWLAVGKLLEKMGFINIVFELMKMAGFFFVCPVSYIFLKIFEMEVGRGYLFSPTEMNLKCTRIFLVFWAIGCICILLYIIFNTGILANHYKDAFLCENRKQRIYTAEASVIGLKKKCPLLMQSYYAKVPCLKGIFKPIILLPVKEYSEEELRVICVHELTHYKQKDVLLKAWILLLLAVHFYNPLIWVLASKMHKWSEFACDYRACKEVGGMKHYFEVIMNMSVELPTHFELSSQLVENQHELVGRVKRMKKIYGKKKSKVSSAMILGAAFMISTMSVSAVTIETAEAYCQWNKATVVEVESDDASMTEYEVFSEQGDAEKNRHRAGSSTGKFQIDKDD